MNRRDFFRRSSLLSLACIPFTTKGIPKEVSQTRKSFEERGKYLDYTEQDFMSCKIILIDPDGNKIWGPPIYKVKLSKQPLCAHMYVKYDLDRYVCVSALRFVDMDNRMLFQPRPLSLGTIHKQRSDTLKLTYTIRLD